ncbi:hypothetical protein [Cupriavidus sp. D39]|uniref:hypothetical protein n=1 Tax=Cupriavidus sp. D39 TaxID=2997877 RepID=UPI00226FD0BC|nr:hypothetical protein [Cupriavidus sp. D39]MCY0858673.1 hypothetical protein [Cupriavidus sp. D39]
MINASDVPGSRAQSASATPEPGGQGRAENSQKDKSSEDFARAASSLQEALKGGAGHGAGLVDLLQGLQSLLEALPGVPQEASEGLAEAFGYSAPSARSPSVPSETPSVPLVNSSRVHSVAPENLYESNVVSSARHRGPSAIIGGHAKSNVGPGMLTHDAVSKLYQLAFGKSKSNAEQATQGSSWIGETPAEHFAIVAKNGTLGGGGSLEGSVKESIVETTYKNDTLFQYFGDSLRVQGVVPGGKSYQPHGRQPHVFNIYYCDQVGFEYNANKFSYIQRIEQDREYRMLAPNHVMVYGGGEFTGKLLLAIRRIW